MSIYSKLPAHNIVRDWEKAQGVSSAKDLTHQIIRDYNIRNVCIQNSATRPVGIAITNYYTGPTPPIKLTLPAGQLKYIGINSHGSYPQYLWLFDSISEQQTGTPAILRNDANEFVIRDGLNKMWVQPFKTGVVSAQK
jgi:hypothetical protein